MTRNTPKIKSSIIVAAFVGVGVIADLLPHPALGPSILLSGWRAMVGDRLPEALVRGPALFHRAHQETLSSRSEPSRAGSPH